MKTILLASGGTGGHIFPALSVAAELSARGYNPVLVTDERYENYDVKQDDEIDVRIIRTGALHGGIIKRISGVIDIGMGYFQSVKLFHELKPSAVIGFGGYPSFPTMFAACRRNLPTIIHEQNSVLGRANYILAPHVKAIATSFSEVSGIQDDDIQKVTVTGNPVRSSIKSIRSLDYPSFLDGGILRILVTGGSQGASVFSHIVPEAIATLPHDLKSRIRIDQQCRQADIEKAKAIYKELGVSADLATFFDDIPSRLASAHIVIARSGASTLAELSVAGRPAIMIPYPNSKDNHQTFNANALEDAGGGWLMPEESFTPSALCAKMESFFNLPSILSDAAYNARKTGTPNADKNLANLIEICVSSHDSCEDTSSTLDSLEMKNTG